MAKVYMVTRHPGAQEWLAKHASHLVTGKDVEVVAHFDVKCVNKGDVVIGILPVNIAQKVCEAGGEFHHLSLEVPAALRGVEMTCDVMETLGANIARYIIFHAEAYECLLRRDSIFRTH